MVFLRIVKVIVMAVVARRAEVKPISGAGIFVSMFMGAAWPPTGRINGARSKTVESSVKCIRTSEKTF